MGEAGAEVAAPLDKLMGYIEKAVAEQIASAGTTNVTVNVLADTSNATIKKIKAAVVEGITKDNKAHKLAIGMF